MMHDEIQRLRRLVALAEDALARCGDRPPGDERLIGVVTAVTALPTTAGVFYGLHPARISGPAAEGGAATIAVDTSRTFHADVIGRAPSLGDRLVARRVADRWAARRGGVAGCGRLRTVVTGCSNPLLGATVTITKAGSVVATGSTVGILSTITVTNTAGNYNSIPNVSISGGGGSGAAAVANMGVGFGGGAITVVNGGTGWAVGNILNIVGGTRTAVAQLRVTAVASGGVITAAVVQAAGSYSVLPTNPVSTVVGGFGGGVGATFDLLWRPVSATVTAAGSGFTSAPLALFDPPISGAQPTTTTTLSAVYDYSYPTSGTYNVSVTRSRFNSFSSNVTATCPTNVNLTANLGVATGYECCAICLPLPDTLFGSTSYGTFTLVWTGNQQAWIGTQTVPAYCAGINGSNQLDCSLSAAGMTQVSFFFGCNSAGGYNLHAVFEIAECSFTTGPNPCWVPSNWTGSRGFPNFVTGAVNGQFDTIGNCQGALSATFNLTSSGTVASGTSNVGTSETVPFSGTVVITE